MLLPRFTVRTLLVITTLCALWAAIGNFAREGQPWAVAVCLGIGGLVLAAVFYMLLFVVAWLGSFVTSRSTTPGSVNTPRSRTADEPSLGR